MMKKKNKYYGQAGPRKGEKGAKYIKLNKENIKKEANISKRLAAKFRRLFNLDEEE